MRKIKVLLAPLAALALLGPAATAQQSHHTPLKVEAVPAPALAKPALWKISDGDTTIYLFGTIHLLPEGIDWYHGTVATAFEQSGQLVTEIPEVNQGETVSLMMKHGLLPQGQTLRGLMTAEEKTKYEATMTGMGLPPAAFDRYKPWFAAMALSILPLQRQGYALENGVEAQLDKRNKALGRSRIGLETLEFQLGIFDGFAPDVQKTYLFGVIDALPNITQEIDKMVSSWSKGDAEALALTLNTESEDPALYEALLVGRNRKWAGWIDDRLDQPGTVFIAVGAGHLGGKGSVQDFLDDRGIKTVRVQ